MGNVSASIPVPEPALSATTAKATVSTVTERYIIERYRRREIGKSTARNLRTTLGQFAKCCGNRPISRVSRREVERWLEDYGAGLAASTRAKRFNMIATFCAWLVDQKLVRRDPTYGMPRPKQPRTVPRAIRPEGVGAVLSHCPDARARLVASLMAQEGLRCMEVAGLEVADVDLNARSLRVVGKGGHERVLPLTDETREHLAAYLTEWPATVGPLVRSYQFPNRSLTAMTIGNIMRAVMYAAGVKSRPLDRVSAHALRHTAATDMLRNGAHVRDVQHILGHKHLMTTEIYLPLVVNDLREAIGGRRYRGATA
jgi:site-specific recombinase XerD